MNLRESLSQREGSAKHQVRGARINPFTPHPARVGQMLIYFA